MKRLMSQVSTNRDLRLLIAAAQSKCGLQPRLRFERARDLAWTCFVRGSMRDGARKRHRGHICRHGPLRITEQAMSQESVCTVQRRRIQQRRGNLPAQGEVATRGIRARLMSTTVGAEAAICTCRRVRGGRLRGDPRPGTKVECLGMGPPLRRGQYRLREDWGKQSNKLINSLMHAQVLWIPQPYP